MKKCPKCQSRKRVHRSRRDLSVLVQLMGFHRFRCTDCNLYFEGFSPIPSYGRKNGHESESEQEFKPPILPQLPEHQSKAIKASRRIGNYRIPVDSQISLSV